MKYKVKFRVIGDKPPFTITLHEDSVNKPAVITKIVTTSNIIDYLVNTQTYEISPSKEYCVKAVDAINNIVDQCNILYPDIPPYVENVTCGGQTIIGSRLTGSYDYIDENGDPESGSLFKWYRSNDNIGTNKIQISGAIAQEYTLTNDDIGKYIQFSVTPKNLNATGDEGLSNYSGVVEDQLIPRILDFNIDTNTLSWIMDDNSEGVGTWSVQYSLDNKLTWVGGGAAGGTAGGSPRSNVLPLKTYNQIIHFRVRRISKPATEYSEVFSKYVGIIHNLTSYSLVHLVNYREASPPSDICTYYNKYITRKIYGTTPTPEVGTKLYFISDDLYQATKVNILANSTVFNNLITNGIGWFYFPGIDKKIWEVDPINGELIDNRVFDWECPLPY